MNRDTAMRDYTIDFSKIETYEGGAVLVSLLARPEPATSDETLGDLQASLCALYLRARADVDPAWAMSPQWIKPLYAQRELRQINRDLRPLGRRLRDRMVAARMAIGFMQEVESGHAPKLPTGVERLSLSQMSLLVLDDLQQTEPGNVESRVWRPSIPVIHLATAVAVTMDQMDKQGLQAPNVGDLISNPELIRHIVNLADHYAVLLFQSRLRIQPEQLIHVHCS